MTVAALEALTLLDGPA